jgi:hypothetical protein
MLRYIQHPEFFDSFCTAVEGLPAGVFGRSVRRFSAIFFRVVTVRVEPQAKMIDGSFALVNRPGARPAVVLDLPALYRTLSKHTERTRNRHADRLGLEPRYWGAGARSSFTALS